MMIKITKKGFTLVELMVVIAIIAILVSITIPAINMARIAARETADKAALNAMEAGLESFSIDHGQYPDSSSTIYNTDPLYYLDSGSRITPVLDFEAGVTGNFSANTNTFVANIPNQGAQLLFQSLVGLDKLGYDLDNFYCTGTDGKPITRQYNYTRRFGPYIDYTNIESRPLKDAQPDGINYTDSGGDYNQNPVFVDSINRQQPRPILYYKANKASFRMVADVEKDGLWDDGIYSYADNMRIVNDNSLHPRFDEPVEFRDFIWNPDTGLAVNNVAAQDHPSARPYRADSFILINAGLDGQYGTGDDITNFPNKYKGEDK